MKKQTDERADGQTNRRTDKTSSEINYIDAVQQLHNKWPNSQIANRQSIIDFGAGIINL